MSNEISNPSLTSKCIKILNERLRSFSYSENQHYRLKEELYNLLNNYWGQNQVDIEGSDENFQKFKFLIDILVEWGSILAGKFQEEFSTSNIP